MSTGTAPCQDGLDGLVHWFETLSPQTVARAAVHYAADAVFRDPFNEVSGVQRIARIYAHMFEQVREPRFRVTQRYRDECSAMLLWEFRFRAGRDDSETLICGASQLRFNSQGLITLHQDYWDPVPQVYRRVPVLGSLLGFLSKRLRAPQD